MERWPLGALVLAAGCTTATPPAQTDAAARTITLADCVQAVAGRKAGTIVKLEGKTEGNALVYEFDVRSADGTQWDIECDAATGAITEVEQEVDAPTDAPFAAKVKISKDSAQALAVGVFAGTVKEVEYEVEENGDASYEIDIVGADGTERKIEIDATRGTVTENNAEHFQIGVE